MAVNQDGIVISSNGTQAIPGDGRKGIFRELSLPRSEHPVARDPINGRLPGNAERPVTRRTQDLINRRNYAASIDTPGTVMGQGSHFQKGSFTSIRHSYGYSTDSMSGKPLSAPRNIISEAAGSMLDDRNMAAGIDHAIDGVKKTDLGFWGNSMRNVFPKQYDKMANSVLNANKTFDKADFSFNGALREGITGASMTGNAEAMTDLSAQFKKQMVGRSGLSMKNSFLVNSNLSFGKSALRFGGQMGTGANAVSKAVLGASLGQIGFAGAAVAGLGYMAGNALGVTREDMTGVASAVNETFKSRPQYGQSQMGQSTQGLVFGLHASRRR